MAEEGFYGRKWSSWTEFERELADYSKDTYQVFATNRYLLWFAVRCMADSFYVAGHN